MVFLLFSFLKEPVLWLVANGRKEEAERVLGQAAHWNRKDPQSILKLFRSRLQTGQASSAAASETRNGHQQSELHTGTEETTTFVGGGECRDVPPKEEREGSEGVDSKLSFLDLFRHPLLRRNLLVALFMW